jgi:CHAP domain
VTAAVLLTATAAVMPVASASAAVSRDKIVSIARSQLGNGCSSTYDGISCDLEWCAAFATWVWGQAGVDVSRLGWTVTTFVNYGDHNGTWHDPAGYTPQPGDAMIFGGSGFPTKASGGAHVGFVESVHADGTLTEIGGNQSGHVNEYSGTAKEIEADLEGNGYNFLGYVSPVEAVNTPAPALHGGSSLTPLANDRFEVAWQGRDANNSLWLGTGSGAGLSAYGDPRLLGVAAGTKPSITTLSDGSWVAAWQGRDAANSLWIATGTGTTITSVTNPYRLGVAPGTSPSIAALPNNQWEVAWQGRDANNSLWLATGSGTTITAKGDPYALGVAAGSSPSVATLPNGGFEVAWQGRDANNSLWLASGSGTTITAKGDPYALGVAAGSSPSLVTLSNGGFEVEWKGRDANGSLWLASGSGTTITAKDDPYRLGVA